MTRRYTGGCHCGAVRFEADIDLAEGTFRCNCTMCWKTRMWGAVRTDDFRLVSGEEDLVDYQPFRVHRPFCGTCGVSSFGWFEDDEGRRIHVARVNGLDDVDVDELLRAPVTYLDGLHDDLDHPPAEVRHLLRGTPRWGEAWGCERPPSRSTRMEKRRHARSRT